MLAKRYNKKTNKKQYCLVSDKDPKKILKWFDKKPTKKELLKEERRINYFKYLKSLGKEDSIIVKAQQWKEKARKMYEKKIQKEIEKELKDKDYKFIKIKTPEVSTKMTDPFKKDDLSITEWEGVSKIDIDYYNKIISDRLKMLDPYESKLNQLLRTLNNLYIDLSEIDVKSHEVDRYIELKRKRMDIIDKINDLKNKRMLTLAQPAPNDEELERRLGKIKEINKEIDKLIQEKDNIDRETYKIYITTLTLQMVDDPEVLKLKNILESINKYEKEFNETLEEINKLIEKIITMPIQKRKEDTKVKIEHVGKDWVEKELFKKEAEELLNNIKKLGEVIIQKYDFKQKYELLQDKKQKLQKAADKFKEIGDVTKASELLKEVDIIEKQILELKEADKSFIKNVLEKYKKLLDEADKFDIFYNEENIKKLEELKKIYKEVDDEVNKSSKIKDLLKSLRESDEATRRFEEFKNKVKMEEKIKEEEKDKLTDSEIIYHLKQYGLTLKDVGLDLSKLTSKERTLSFIKELANKKKKELEEIKKEISERKNIPMFKYILNIIPEMENILYKEVDNIVHKHIEAIPENILEVVELIKKSNDAEKLIKVYYYLLKEYEGYSVEDIDSNIKSLLKTYNIDFRDRLISEILDLVYEYSRELLGDRMKTKKELEDEARIQAYKRFNPRDKESIDKFIKEYVERKIKEEEEKLVKSMEDLKEKITKLDEKSLVTLLHSIKEKGLSRRFEDLSRLDTKKDLSDISREVTREYSKINIDYLKHISDEDLEKELRRVIRLSEGIAEEGEERFIGKISEEHVQVLLDEYNRRMIEREKHDNLLQSIANASKEVDSLPINEFANIYTRVIKRLDQLISAHKNEALREMLKEQEKLPPFARKRKVVTNKDVVMYLLKNKLITPKDYAVYERGLRDYNEIERFITK